MPAPTGPVTAMALLRSAAAIALAAAANSSSETTKPRWATCSSGGSEVSWVSPASHVSPALLMALVVAAALSDSVGTDDRARRLAIAMLLPLLRRTTAARVVRHGRNSVWRLQGPHSGSDRC